MQRLALIVMLVACGGSSKTSTTPAGRPAPTEVGNQIPSTPGPACHVVGEKVATVALSDNMEDQAQMSSQVKTRCVEDKWSDEARNCFATVENDQEIDGCKQKLTAAQRDALGPARDRGSEATAASATKGSAAATKASSPVSPKTDAAKKPRGGSRSGDPCEGGE